jgi:tetrahedral aminopeptidase
MKELIKKLVEATGPSGYENQVRDLVRSEVEKIADEIRVDALGNLIVKKGQGGPKGRKIMLAGHMDEIGVMVTHIDDRGFVRFTNVGGVYPINCMGGRVRFLNGTPGVINAERIAESDRVPSLDKMYIDVGATSRENCPVKVGDIACFDRPFVDMGKHLVSKAMDDRIAVAIMVSVLQQIKKTPNELYFVFTVQEEVGLRGATTAAYGVDPELGIAVDVTGAGDTPKGFAVNMKLGNGAAIKVRDNSIIVDPRLVNWAVKTAEEKKIPYQMEVLPFGGTDTAAINLTRAGAPAICISVPTRYIHSPSEMVDYDDVLNTVRLVLEMVSNPVEL